MNQLKIITIKTGSRKTLQTTFDKSKDVGKKASIDIFSILNCQNIHPHSEFQKYINTNLVIDLILFISI